MKYYSAIKNDFIKFLGKWMELENIILSEVTQSQNIQTWFVLTDDQILDQMFRIPKIQFTDHMNPKKKDHNVAASVLFRMVNKKLTGRNMETKCD